MKFHHNNYAEFIKKFYKEKEQNNRFDILFYFDIYHKKFDKQKIEKIIENFLSSKKNVYQNILRYILIEQNPKFFDPFWTICVLFYSIYHNYFFMSFKSFFSNIIEFKVFFFSYKHNNFNRRNYFIFPKIFLLQIAW